MELVEVFRLIRVIRLNFLQTVTVVGTLLVHTLVDDEELTAFDGNQGVSAEGTAEDHMVLHRISVRKEGVAADFAEELAFIAIIFIEIDHWRAASGTADILRDVTLVVPADRLQFFAIL